MPEKTSADIRDSCIEEGKGPLLFLWGDSIAATLYRGLKSVQQEMPFRIAQFTTSRCRPILGDNPVWSPHCNDINEKVLKIIAERKPDIVLLKGQWKIGDPERLKPVVERIRSAGVRRVVIVGLHHFGETYLPELAVKYYRLHHEIIPERMNNVFEKFPEFDASMEAFAKAMGIEYIDAWPALCNDNGCRLRVGGTLVGMDSSHFTGTGSELFVRGIADKLFASQ